MNSLDNSNYRSGWHSSTTRFSQIWDITAASALEFKILIISYTENRENLEKFIKKSVELEFAVFFIVEPSCIFLKNFNLAVLQMQRSTYHVCSALKPIWNQAFRNNVSLVKFPKISIIQKLTLPFEATHNVKLLSNHLSWPFPCNNIRP